MSLLLFAACMLEVAAQHGYEDDDNLKAQVKGFVDSYHAVRAGGRADWMASRTRLRGELKLQKGAASLFTSLNATYNRILPERTGISLREAYLSYTPERLDLRIGRQIIVWGVADGLRITDCVSPFDFTEFLAQDYDDIRMPVNGMRARYSLGAVTMEAVCVPVAEMGLLPTEPHNAWSLTLPDSPMPYTIDLQGDQPLKKLRNMEYGGRVLVTLRGVDFSFSALRSWNKMPAVETTFDSNKGELRLRGKYHRMTLLGADCSVPVGEFVLRAEGACYLGEAQSTSVDYEVVRRHSLNGLIGLDWYPGNDWNVNLQYSHKHILGDMQYLSSHRHAGLATVRISKDLLQNSLKLSTFAYIDVTNGGLFNRFSVGYALTDELSLFTGYDFFYGERGMFKNYRHNSEVWIKMKYSF